METATTRTHAYTTPIVQEAPTIDLVRSSTNYVNRDRHAVPPSILAQNRELLGIVERPRALTCDKSQHNCSEPIHSDSPGKDHIEHSEGTIATVFVPQPRRRSTLTMLGETARKTGKIAKRRISKVIPWKRRDSGQEDEPRSPPTKVHRMKLGSGSQATQSRTALLGDGEADASSAWEEASSSPFRMTDNQRQTPLYESLQIDLSDLQRVSANPRDWQASPQTLLRLSVEYNHQHCQSSPDCFPHECLMESELWDESERRLERVARQPELVAERFDRIYGQWS